MISALNTQRLLDSFLSKTTASARRRLNSRAVRTIPDSKGGGTYLLELSFFPLLLIGSNQHHFHRALPAACFLLAHLTRTSDSALMGNFHHFARRRLPTTSLICNVMFEYLLLHVVLEATGCDEGEVGEKRWKVELASIQVN